MIRAIANKIMRIKIIIGIAVLMLLTAPFIVYFLSPVGSADTSVNVVLEKGDGLKEIIRKLKDVGLIKSPAAFAVYSVFTGSAHRLKAGAYELGANWNVPQIVNKLVAGPPVDLAITIKEGATVAEIEKELAEAGIIKLGDLHNYPGKPFGLAQGKSLEGFLFPDTYRFFPNSSPDVVVEKFSANFNKKALPLLQKTSRDIYKTLIMASLIEKEVPFQDDRHLVAGILYKRLKIGMALQVDAESWTYENAGLPPRPIANPGLGAIIAAVFPRTSPYLYYLSDPITKKTIFAETFEEHKENKFRYLNR